MNRQKYTSNIQFSKNSAFLNRNEVSKQALCSQKKFPDSNGQFKYKKNRPRISKQKIMKKQNSIEDQQKFRHEVSIQDYNVQELKNNYSREQYYGNCGSLKQKIRIQQTKKYRKMVKNQVNKNKQHFTQLSVRKKHSSKNVETIGQIIDDQDKKRSTKSTSLRKMRTIQRNGVIDSNGNIVYCKRTSKKSKKAQNQKDSRSCNFLTITNIQYSLKHSKNGTKDRKVLSKAKSDKKIQLKFLNRNKINKNAQFTQKSSRSKIISKKMIETKNNLSNYIEKLYQQQTEVTPSHQHISNITNYRFHYAVDYELVRQQITNYKQKHQLHRNSSFSKQQIQKFILGISKISNLSCEILSTNQIYFLAFKCFTSFFINNSLRNKSSQITAAASLLIAIKMQDPYRINQFHQLFKLNTRKQKTEKNSSNQKVKKSKSKDRKSIKQFQPQLKKLDLNSVFKQIIEQQFEIMKHLRFHLNSFTIFTIVQTLTAAWDQFIKHYYQQIYTIYINYLFRYPGKNSKYKFLVQIMQLHQLYSTIFQVTANHSDDVQVVLCVMYLLLRISLQLKENNTSAWKKSVEHYRNNLSESTNIIFIDSAGINQLFGNFLKLLQFNYGHLINSFSFVGKYFEPQIFVYEFSADSLNLQFDQIYTHNQKMYDSLNKKVDKLKN